jgi:hypothetical protein
MEGAHTLGPWQQGAIPPTISLSVLALSTGTLSTAGNFNFTLQVPEAITFSWNGLQSNAEGLCRFHPGGQPRRHCPRVPGRLPEGTLAPEERNLISEYYQGQKQAKIDTHGREVAEKRRLSV